MTIFYAHKSFYFFFKKRSYGHRKAIPRKAFIVQDLERFCSFKISVIPRKALYKGVDTIYEYARVIENENNEVVIQKCHRL